MFEIYLEKTVKALKYTRSLVKKPRTVLEQIEDFKAPDTKETPNPMYQYEPP